MTSERVALVLFVAAGPGCLIDASHEVTRLVGIWQVEASGLHIRPLQRQIDPGDFAVCATQWAQHQKVLHRIGQNHPFAATCFDEGTNSKRHGAYPFISPKSQAWR